MVGDGQRDLSCNSEHSLDYPLKAIIVPLDFGRHYYVDLVETTRIATRIGSHNSTSKGLLRRNCISSLEVHASNL